MKHHISFFLVISILLISGCKKDSTTSPPNTEQPNQVYPLTIGNRWIYSVGDTIIIDRTTSLNGKIAHHILGDDDYTFGERNLYYEGTVLYGWDGSDTVATQLFDENLLQTLPIETVTVPAGTFDAYKYSWGNLTTKIYWFRKGVGVVKSNNNGSIIELVSYTIN